MSKNRFVMVLPNTVELNASADSFPVERIQGSVSRFELRTIVPVCVCSTEEHCEN